VEIRKILTLGVLTYLVFGLVSLFQLGVFLPPMPLKSVLILAVVLVALILDKSGPKGIRLLLGGLTVLYVGAHTTFWELFLNYETYALIQQDIETYFLLITALLLPIFNYLFLLSLVDTKKLRLILHVTLLLFVPFFIIYPSIYTIDLALIGMAILYFFIGYSPFFDKPLTVLRNVLDIFIVIGLVNMIDRIVFLIY